MHRHRVVQKVKNHETKKISVYNQSEPIENVYSIIDVLVGFVSLVIYFEEGVQSSVSA